MSERWRKIDDGDRFLLVSAPGGTYAEPWEVGDSIGRGAAFHSMRFLSAEGREYFIQADEARRGWRRARWELDCLRDSLRGAVKKRNVRKRISELIG